MNIPLQETSGLIKLGPGYALDGAQGNITDDTYIRLDLTRFLLDNDLPYTARRFASWLLEHADFSNWWKVAVLPLRRIESEETTAEKAGLNHKQGGGGGWWQPIAMLYAGDPEGASTVTADLCRIWKAPLEQNIRITYFDEEVGQSQVILFIKGQEKVTFKLDEDVDCWRWRMFENIQVNNGDEITLVGKADQNEKATLNYIEFIRQIN